MVSGQVSGLKKKMSKYPKHSFKIKENKLMIDLQMEINGHKLL